MWKNFLEQAVHDQSTVDVLFDQIVGLASIALVIYI